MIRLAWPWLLVALPLPWLAWRLLPPAPAVSPPALFAPFVLAVFGDRPTTAARRRRWTRVLAALVWLLLVMAAARPQWLGEPVELPQTGRSLMLAVDASGSMEIPDLDLSGSEANRLAVVKEVAGEFIRRRVGDRIGLVIFGSQAYLQAPLTLDRTTVANLLAETEIGIAGKETAIGDAIGLAVKRLKEVPQGKAALVLLTDGANTAGLVPPKQAADLAAQAGIRIYTIGVGADRVVVRGFLGSRVVNPSADLDEETLEYLASATGGRFFRAKDKEGLAEVYRRIDELEPVATESLVVRPRTDLFVWPLAAALTLSALRAAAALWPRRPRREAHAPSAA
ncbi:MAG: VWA domain-containing protein [Thermodesulfobacteriota bacterium]